MKIQGTGVVPREDAVQHERVYTYVQIEGSPEPLDHGYRAAAPVQDATIERTRAQAPEHSADEHGNDSAAHVVFHATWYRIRYGRLSTHCRTGTSGNT